MKRLSVALCALLMACGNDDEPLGQPDAAPPDDAQTGPDGAPLHDAGTDAWTEPTPDAGHPLYRACTPGGGDEQCPPIPFDGGAFTAGFITPDAGRSPGCYEEHKIVKGRDLYGTCIYACGVGAVPDPPLNLACASEFGSDCVRPWDVVVGGPVCLPGD